MSRSSALTHGLSDYELLLPIGEGGMAQVWAGRALGGGPGELVAIKVLRPALMKRPELVGMFHEEAELARQIQHRNVVQVYGAHWDGRNAYMVMEWIEGDSLHELIAEAGKRSPIPTEIAVRIIADAARGLHGAHEARDAYGRPVGVIHRDVSPHNILVRRDGAIKLVDFGVAKLAHGLLNSQTARQIEGKFGYMSPEQVRSAPVDRRSDIFSLGVVLFELTTGRRLFWSADAAESMDLVLSAEIPRPSRLVAGYPLELEQIVLTALERRVEQRYGSADAFRRDLEAFLRRARIVVPEAGVGALLERVLGAQLAERREALLRAARMRPRARKRFEASGVVRYGADSEAAAGVSLLERVRLWASSIWGGSI